MSTTARRARVPALGRMVLGGRRYAVPGIKLVTYLDDPEVVPRTPKTSERRTPLQVITLHTTWGIGGPVEPGLAPDRSIALNYLRNAAREGGSAASWDFLIGRDGIAYQQNDPVPNFTWGAGGINPYAMHIEIEQETGSGRSNEGQYKTLLALLDALTLRLGIQRQIPWYQGEPDHRILTRLRPEGGSGRDVVGVVAHRNQTTERGHGDPGDHPFQLMKRAGYMGFDFQAEADKAFWRRKQGELGLPATGVPDSRTTAELEARGYPGGVLVDRRTFWEKHRTHVVMASVGVVAVSTIAVAAAMKARQEEAAGTLDAGTE